MFAFAKAFSLLVATCGPLRMTSIVSQSRACAKATMASLLLAHLFLRRKLVSGRFIIVHNFAAVPVASSQDLAFTNAPCGRVCRNSISHFLLIPSLIIVDAVLKPYRQKMDTPRVQCSIHGVCLPEKCRLADRLRRQTHRNDLQPLGGLVLSHRRQC